jgi:hypothetical protein
VKRAELEHTGTSTTARRIGVIWRGACTLEFAVLKAELTRRGTLGKREPSPNARRFNKLDASEPCWRFAGRVSQSLDRELPLCRTELNGNGSATRALEQTELRHTHDGLRHDNSYLKAIGADGTGLHEALDDNRRGLCHKLFDVLGSKRMLGR